MDFHDYFWKLNLMSDICEVTWNRKLVSVICRVTWFIIRPTIWNEFDIVCIKLWAFFFSFKFYMLSVKFNYAAPFSLLKLFQSWFHPLVRSFDLLGTFLLVFCLWLFNISSICSRDVFDPVKCKAQGFFATAFHCCFWISHSVFCSVSHRRSFYLRYPLQQSHCVLLKVLHVSGFFLPLSLLKYFLSRGNWSLTELIFPS